MQGEVKVELRELARLKRVIKCYSDIKYTLWFVEHRPIIQGNQTLSICNETLCIDTQLFIKFVIHVYWCKRDQAAHYHK